MGVTTTPSARTPSKSSSLPDSPASAADDISLAVQNGELSAAARIFVPTNLSPAKTLTSSASGGGTPGRLPGPGSGGLAAQAAAGATPPRLPATVGSSSPVLRSSPRNPGGGGGGLGLQLGDGVFGTSWGSMGSGVMGNNGSTSASAVDSLGLGGETDAKGNGGTSSSLWGSLGMDMGVAAVPASGQAIWGSSPLLGPARPSGDVGGDGLSLLLTSSGQQASGVDVNTSMSSFSSPLDLSSWGVGSSSGGQGVGAASGNDFAGGLASTLGGLQLDEPDNVPSGKAGQKQQQQQPGGLFGARGDAAGSSSGLSWG